MLKTQDDFNKEYSMLCMQLGAAMDACEVASTNKYELKEKIQALKTEWKATQQAMVAATTETPKEQI